MKLFGLIGYPLTHSFSKRYFTEKFEKEKINARYDLYELKQIELFSELKKLPELSGLNVTIPYKESILPFLDEIDETALQIGAVNVIKFSGKDKSLKLKGYNSDIIGFENALFPYLKPFHNKALVLGTGGAAKAVVFVLKRLGMEVTLVSRTQGIGKITYEMLGKEIMEQHKLIINATPVGTFPHSDECPPIPYQFLTSQHFLFDVVYNPAQTLFLKKGKEMGASGINGEAMLIGQAEASWEIWNSGEEE
jgi:shikimate dehydrogenase